MASFKTVEEIQVWQHARVLMRFIYEFTSARPFARDFALVDQIRRAAISIMSNITEGFERGRFVEFAHFLRIAKGSAGEVKTQLDIALDQGYIQQDQFNIASTHADDIGRMITSLIAYLTHSKSETRNDRPATPNPTSDSQRSTRNCNDGFVLPAAVFLLVVLGGLATWMMQLTTATLAQEDLEIQGARAYQAAQAGLEAGIYAATQSGGSCVTVAQNIAFNSGSLSGFTASLSCTPTTANEAGTTENYYQITSVACNQPTAGACPNAAPAGEYAERQMRATVEGG